MGWKKLGRGVGRLPLALQLLLAANILYCLIAATDNALPGWKMFGQVGPQDYHLVGPDGASHALTPFLPKDAYNLTAGDFERVGCFAAGRLYPGGLCRLVSAAKTTRITNRNGKCEVVR